MIKLKFTLVLMFVIFIPLLFSQNKKTTMIIKNWKFKQADKSEWYPAQVPGTVHTDLFTNKIIADPFYRTNERDQQWIDKVDWEYKAVIVADDDLLKRENIHLLFKGLDTYADIFLNETKILSVNNMFREWQVECTSLFKTGENMLRIYFHSPIKIDIPKLENLGYQLPAGNDQSENGGLGDKKISIFARKAGYHYGWDWGPRFVTAGIWRPVLVEAWDNARIDDLHIIQRYITEDNAKLSAVFEIRSSVEKEITLAIATNQELGAAKHHLKKGTNKIIVNFEIDHPELWWTNGLGEQHLYNITGFLKIDGQTIDQKSTKIGLRTIRVVREKDEAGKTFYFELNGVPVFAKGANYIPCDNFAPRVTNEHYEHIIKSAATANMNMLRVWGGGIYENDIFYDLCDEYGLLVWQDFMFACSMYPGDEAFVENVKQEAIQNVKRLRNHPCIALWCGNNEIDAAWSHDTPGGWGWKERFDKETRSKIWNDYETVFHNVLPAVVAKYDSARFYWPSSPLADFGKRASYESTSGDIHYWGVWHGKEPFENFQHKIGRFMSEYGFQSFPEMKTIKSYTIPTDWDINSEVMAAHQRSGIGNQRIKMYMDWYYRDPKNFQSLIYTGQVLQAEGIKFAIEAHRAKMPYCMGTLYWQLNDCWPVASWAGIDYFGRWKALNYFAKKAFEDVLVIPLKENGNLNIFIVSDKQESFPAELFIEIADFSGNQLWRQKSSINVKSNTSHNYFSKKTNKLIQGMDPSNIYLKAVVIQNGKIVSQNHFHFVAVKDLTLPQPDISYEIDEILNGYRIRIVTEKYAKNVYLTTKAAGFFSDNYFDILPGETIEINFTCADKQARFAETLKIMTLFDSYK